MRSNPYVGPRPYRQGEALYGREEGVRNILDLLLVERIVVLHSPSGSGKTSLIEAALRPQLPRLGLDATPSIRLRNSRNGADGWTLGTAMSEAFGVAPTGLSAAGVWKNYRGELRRANGGAGRFVLVFDQFEEIVRDSTWQSQRNRQQFFEGLGELLSDRSTWCLISVREDYIGPMEPYFRSMPTRMASRYRLDLLSVTEAAKVIREPARGAGVDISEELAIQLASELGRSRAAAQSQAAAARMIEPVHLQVVCADWWNNLPDGTVNVPQALLPQVGNVDAALAAHYRNRVNQAAGSRQHMVVAVREWFDRKLIGPEGYREQTSEVPQMADAAEAASALDRLEDSYLIRRDERHGQIWYELAHDRLVDPVRTDNQRWFAENLNALQLDARLWDAGGRKRQDLARGEELARVRRSAAGSPARPGAETDFLAASEEEDRLNRMEQRRVRQLRAAYLLLLVGAAAATAGGAYYTVSLTQTRRQLSETVAEVQSVQLERDQAKKDIEPLRAEIAPLRVQKAELEKQVGGYKTQVGEYKEKIATAERSLAATTADREHLKVQVAELTALRQRLDEETRKLISAQLGSLEIAATRLAETVRRDFLPNSNNKKIHTDRLAEIDALRSTARAAVAGGDLALAESAVAKFTKRIIELEGIYYGPPSR